MLEQLGAELDDWERLHHLRQRRMVNGPQGVVIDLEGRSLINFSSNDYLGLAGNPRVIAAMQRGAQSFGVGSGSAHLISGHNAPHHALEQALAAFIGTERALLFSTGYMANLGVISALVGRKHEVFEDRLNHASLIDGGLLSRARFRRYPHVDTGVLGQQIEASPADRKLVVTDGVFSMDGDQAPLRELVEIKKRTGAWLMVDDAHGLGILGEGGRGIGEAQGVEPADIDILVGTLGKALGTFGAFVAGSAQLIEYLVQKARTYIFTTALPPAVAEATRESLAIVEAEPWRREKLQFLVHRFREGAASRGLQLSGSGTPIQPLPVGESQRTVALSRILMQRGIFVPAIRPPSVPEGTSRLRITFSAGHEAAHVDKLLDSLEAGMSELN